MKHVFALFVSVVWSSLTAIAKETMLHCKFQMIKLAFPPFLQNIIRVVWVKLQLFYLKLSFKDAGLRNEVSVGKKLPFR